MKLSIKAGSASQSINIFIQDSSSTTGAGLTGLVFNTASLVAYYALPKAAAVQITLATLAAITTAYSSGGFKEIDATNMPGFYRLDLPDAAIASGRFVSVMLKGATNMAPIPIEIELTAWDNQDTVRGGLTALPNAAAEAAGGLYTRGSGAGQINQPANGQVDINVVKLLGTAWLTPAVAGTPDVNTKTLTANAITATAINADAITAAKVADGTIDAATFAANALDAVWSTAARLLTAGTNIVLAKGVGVTGLNDLDAAGVRTAVGLGSANLDTQLATIAGYLDTEIAAILAAVDTEVASILALLNSARGEPAQGAPPVNPNMATKVDYIYKSWRNKKDNDGTTTKLYADDATTVDHKQTTSEAAGTVTKGEWATGP